MTEPLDQMPTPAAGPDGAAPAASADRPLVERSLRGDLRAFEELIARYQKSVFHIALYKSRNYFDAEDLTQDVFLAAHKALPTLRDLDNFGGWLFGIAHNRANKWFQRQRVKVIQFQEIQRLRLEEARRRPEEVQEGPAPGEIVSRSLQSLPQEMRQVLVLKYLEGRNYDSIGERLGISFHRIDYLIRKGKALLRSRLSGSGEAMDSGRRDP